MEARLRQAVQGVIDRWAFSGPIGPAQEQSLVRDISVVVRKLVPRGTGAVVHCTTEDVPDGVSAVVEIQLLGGPQRVRTIRFDIVSM